MPILGQEMLFLSKCAIASLIAAGGAWYLDIFQQLDAATFRNAAGIVAQIGATMLGFVLAALAILATVVNTRLIRNMQRTGHYRVLLRRMFGAVAAFGFVTIAGLVFIFMPTVQSIYVYPFIALILFSVLLLLDVSVKFWMVLHHLHPELPQG